MSHTYASQQRLTSEPKTYTDSKERARNKYSKQMHRQGQLGSNTNVRWNKLPNMGQRKDLRGQFIVLEGAMHQDVINSVEILTHNVGAQNIKRKSWRTSRMI